LRCRRREPSRRGPRNGDAACCRLRNLNDDVYGLFGQEIARAFRPFYDRDAPAMKIGVEVEKLHLERGRGAIQINMVEGEPTVVLVDQGKRGTRDRGGNTEGVRKPLYKDSLSAAERTVEGQDGARLESRGKLGGDPLRILRGFGDLNAQTNFPCVSSVSRCSCTARRAGRRG